jgi:creatinine amidohydrolase
MTSADVRALDRERACVVLSVSPVEEHGPHLPLGTDILESEAVARRLCERLAVARPDTTFLFHPPIPIGADTFADVGSIEVRPSTVRAVVRDVGLSLARNGFRRLMIANHHGGPSHFMALDDAARAIERRSDMRVLSIAGRLIIGMYMDGGLKALFDHLGTPEADRKMLSLDVHAGAWETSELLAVRPDLVREGWRDLETVTVPLEKLTITSSLHEGRGLGYFGAPSLASAELGERYMQWIAEHLAPDAVRFLDGERVPGLSLKWRFLVKMLVLVSKLRGLRAPSAPKIPAGKMPARLETAKPEAR